MFETEGLVSRFSTIATHLSFSSGVTYIHVCFRFYTNINFTRTVSLYISTITDQLLRDGVVCTEVLGRPVSYV